MSDFTEDDLYDMHSAKQRHPYAPAGDGEMFSTVCSHALVLDTYSDDEKTISDAEPSQIGLSKLIRYTGHDCSVISVAEPTQVTKRSYYSGYNGGAQVFTIGIDALEYDRYKFSYLNHIDHADDDLIGDAEVTTVGIHLCDEPVRRFHLQEDGQISAYAA